jgi:calcineurin-like phosphoesterase family protein
MGKFYFTSDTHFNHANIIVHCNRPFKDVKEMNEILIKNWNDIVTYDDTIFHLGDFSLNCDKEFLNRLNGKIIHIKGNHDHKGPIIEDIMIFYGGKYWQLIHDPWESENDFVLCGHVHDAWKVKTINNRIIVNVGVDVWNFKPITIQDILNELVKNQYI